jgi:hypothetical protein
MLSNCSQVNQGEGEAKDKLGGHSGTVASGVSVLAREKGVQGNSETEGVPQKHPSHQMALQEKGLLILSQRASG